MGGMVVGHLFWVLSGRCPRTRPDVSADALGAKFGNSAWRCSNSGNLATGKGVSALVVDGGDQGRGLHS